MTISSFDDFNSFVYVGCSQNSNAAAATPAYGLFQCRTDLPTSDCATCVRSALDKLPSLCPYATFAAVQLKGCFVRYSNDSFIGNPDTALVYKKCGGSGSEMVGLRDAALGELGGGGTGEYRVGAAGRVRALAQCVGDQGARECSECVAAAVEQVKDVCGAANAGNVYLGKCYVSYWSGGAYDSDRSSHYHARGNLGQRKELRRRWESPRQRNNDTVRSFGDVGSSSTEAERRASALCRDAAERARGVLREEATVVAHGSLGSKTAAVLLN
ncbi:hypothetical protein ZIOFF_018236 [Zingiber officinale]|uniref:Gnk2-homologous domain-containing protein n=1 Tax=Zingiber officinale TaxID=94328 RepID=A0A8J5HCQ2_ZINOF|nr:hypothetical protein ZIOFF_018236 [Zingiber officinale]